MIVDLLEVFGLEMAAESYSGTWWANQPPPKPHFTVFGIVIYDFVSLLWTTNLGIVTSVSTCVAVMACLLAVITTYLMRYFRWRRRKKKWSEAPLKPDRSKTPRSLCHKCRFRKKMKNPKKAQMHWKPAINESTETEQEMEWDNHVPIHKCKQGFYCMKKKGCPGAWYIGETMQTL
ncbi:uncharacterized protein [Heptranchias perlo]|uniref:uncharacterized protein isoform X2 n=1 Tax=Heptranchias perlo TaxID=212740 RepID=UPI00355AB771